MRSIAGSVGLRPADAEYPAPVNCGRTILAVLTGAAVVLLGGVGVLAVEPLALDLPAEWQREFRTLEADLTNRVRFEKVAPQTHHPAGNEPVTELVN